MHCSDLFDNSLNKEKAVQLQVVLEIITNQTPNMVD